MSENCCEGKCVKVKIKSLRGPFNSSIAVGWYYYGY